MTRFISLTMFVIGLVCSSLAAANDTTFTYQGELQDNGNLANGSFNIDFSLWDAISHGNQIGMADEQNNVPVVNGKFTVQLNFGASVFDNSDRWLQISVNGTELAPRQPVTRAPYSIQTRGIFVNDNDNVGIGTTIPTAQLHVQGDSATLRLENNSSPGSYTALREDSNVRTALKKVNTSGGVLIDIDPIPLDSFSDASLRLFRTAKTRRCRPRLRRCGRAWMHWNR